MCEPVTIASAATMVAGGALKAKGDLDAASVNADTLRANADLAEQAAGDAVTRGAQQEGLTRLRGGMAQGEQKAALSASGVDAQSGSALDVLSDTAFMTEFDAQVVKNNAAREAFGYRTQAKQMRRQARAIEDAAPWQAAGSLLGGISGGASAALPLMRVK